MFRGYEQYERELSGLSVITNAGEQAGWPPEPANARGLNTEFASQGRHQ